nr:hypothetical protein [Mimivirus sp.]
MANRNSTKSTRVNTTSERNVGNKRPTYQFQMNRSQNEVQEREPNLAERFGHYPVVTSSLSLLISFLLRQLNYMSKRDSKTFGKIVDWSKQSLDGVATHRNSLQKLANEVSRCQLNCGAWSSLKCYESESENGDVYCGSSWYSGKIKFHLLFLSQTRLLLLKHEQIIFWIKFVLDWIVLVAVLKVEPIVIMILLLKM